MLLYHDLADWYPLIDPVSDHADEAAVYARALEHAVPDAATLLELGAGAGNNAFHLKSRFRCTLTDLSERMLELSRAQNPECEHVTGDMRTLRLGRQFDTVLVHDAIVYMVDEGDLGAVMETAFLHTRPGGAALFAPDHIAERLAERSELHQGDSGQRSLRCLSWTWDPDPRDTTYSVEYAFLLRDGDTVRAAHDRHLEGLFPRATWLRLLEQVGYRVEEVVRPIGEGHNETDEVFLCRRPSQAGAQPGRDFSRGGAPPANGRSRSRTGCPGTAGPG